MNKKILIFPSFIFVLTSFLFLSYSPTFAFSSELLSNPWILTAKSGPGEAYHLEDPNVLKGAQALQVTYNLNGTCLLSGDASSLVIDQPYGKDWHFVSLSNYGKNCTNTIQSVEIPLSQFPRLQLDKPIGTLHIRIWHFKPYTVQIYSIKVIPKQNLARGKPSFRSLLSPLLTSSPTFTLPTPSLFFSPTSIPTLPPTPILSLVSSQTPSPLPTPTSTASLSPTQSPSSNLFQRGNWSIQSVSSMKETKDRICSPRSSQWISKWLDRAVSLGANYVSIETPYENPACGDALSYTKLWVNLIRSKGLRVWHRHMPLSFEGIYNIPKLSGNSYLNLISSYIVKNPELFSEGDIFTPIPEPQNGGITGVTYCAYGICQFRNASEFNKWLRDAMDISENTFTSINLKGKIKVGYFGFDGFVAWGDNNPDWTGILEDETVKKMGNITIDHYPEAVGDTMENDLGELENRYPNIPIVIGEWGTISGGDTEFQVQKTLTAAKRPSVVGINYWHMGIGGNEELIREDFSLEKQYDDVQKFYTNL